MFRFQRDLFVIFYDFVVIYIFFKLYLPFSSFWNAFSQAGNIAFIVFDILIYLLNLKRVKFKDNELKNIYCYMIQRSGPEGILGGSSNLLYCRILPFILSNHYVIEF